MQEIESDVEMAEHLSRITQEVFLLMTDIELQPCAMVDSHPVVAAKLCYRTLPGLELELGCEPSLAFALTQRLMSLDAPPAVVDDAVRDSVGEIVNMVGGNFHSIFSPGAALDTTPQLADPCLEGRRVRMEVCLKGEQGSVQLRLTDVLP